MRVPWLAFSAAAALQACLLGESAPTRVVVTAKGARGDGVTVNTAAIQSAIDDCEAKGGGTVVIPPGVFLSGALFLKPHVSLEVQKDGVLKGTTKADDYPLVPTRWEGTEMPWTAALLNVFHAAGTHLSGAGTIDGSGDAWPMPVRRPPEANATTPAPAVPRIRRGRPRLIALQDCSGVTVDGLHLKNQASWCLFMLYSRQITASHLTITALHTIPSSDGMDIDSCDGVHVTGCDIDVNDDCISIKSGKDEEGRRINRPAEHILIEHTRFGYGHGAVAMGSEVSGGIRHVEVRDCVVEDGNWAAVRFKSQPSRGGVIEDIVYRDIQIRGAKQAIEINQAWRMVPPVAAPYLPATLLKDIAFIRVCGTVSTVGVLHGLSSTPLTGIRFEDCRLVAKTGLRLEYVGAINLQGLAAVDAAGRPLPTQ